MTEKTRKQRAKAPSRYGNGTHPQRAPKKNYFAELMSTPEGRAKRKEWSSRPRKNAGRPKGVPDGFRKETIEVIRKEKRQEAEKVVEIMAKKVGVEDNYAKEALTTAVEIMRSPDATRERLQAARLVLDFTKQKPATKSEMAISQAESFLEGLLKEEEQQNGRETESSTQETAH